MTNFEALQIIAANLPEAMYDNLGVNLLTDERREEVETILDKLIGREAKVLNRRAEDKVIKSCERKFEIDAMRPTIRTCLAGGAATVKEIFARDEKTFTRCGITVQKLQYILLHDMQDEVEAQDNGRNAKTYKLREGV